MEKKTFQTDMNERERRKFAKTLRAVAEHATRTAVALESEPYDDSKFVLDFIVLSLMLATLHELSEIVKDAATKEQPPEFPSIIGG